LRLIEQILRLFVIFPADRVAGSLLAVSTASRSEPGPVSAAVVTPMVRAAVAAAEIDRGEGPVGMTALSEHAASASTLAAATAAKRFKLFSGNWARAFAHTLIQGRARGEPHDYPGIVAGSSRHSNGRVTSPRQTRIPPMLLLVPISCRG